MKSKPIPQTSKHIHIANTDLALKIQAEKKRQSLGFWAENLKILIEVAGATWHDLRMTEWLLGG